VDIHCVTRWSKLGTQWRGVSVDTLLDQVAADAPYVLAFCDGGYTTNLPAEDVTGGKACVAFGYDGRPLEAEHGGPARLLVPPDWQVPVVRCGELVDRRLRAPGIGGVWLDGGGLFSTGAEISHSRSTAEAWVNRDWSPCMASSRSLS